MTTTAYATRSDNPLGADASVSVHDETGQIAGTVTDLTLDGAGHALDADAADAMLAGLGYQRTEPWRESGGQWGATVEPVHATTVAVGVGDAVTVLTDLPEDWSRPGEIVSTDGQSYVVELEDGHRCEVLPDQVATYVPADAEHFLARESEDGAETLRIRVYNTGIRTEVHVAYALDGSVLNDSVAYEGTEGDKWLRRQMVDWRAEGYR